MNGLRDIAFRDGESAECDPGAEGIGIGTGEQFRAYSISGREIQTGHREGERRAAAGCRKRYIVIVNLPPASNPNGNNITVRGMTPTGLEMREGIRIASGRLFETGRREVVVGKDVAAGYPDSGLGQNAYASAAGTGRSSASLTPARSAANSEIFVDLNQVAADFQRTDVINSVHVRATDAVAAAALINDLNDRPAAERGGIFRERILRQADRVGRAGAIHRHFRLDHHGGGQRICGGQYDVRGGGAALAGDRHAAGARIFARQHSAELFGGSGVAVGLGRSAGLPADVAAERHHDRDRQQHHLRPDRLRFSREARRSWSTGVLFAVVLGAVGGLFPARSAAKKEILHGAAGSLIHMDDELKSLRIDRTQARSDGASKWARRWILGGIALFVLLGLSAIRLSEGQRGHGSRGAARPLHGGRRRSGRA